MRLAADVDALRSWNAPWPGLRVLVLGLGSTGFAVADTLTELRAVVRVVAERADPERADLLEVIGAEFLLGSLDSARALDDFSADLLVVSPGFAPSHPIIVEATSRGIPIWGDVELAWRLRDKVSPPAKWIAVTGTNGKTTTVGLTTAMIAASGLRVVACGNVGMPVLDAIREPTGFDVLVVELSSFQLHYALSLSPHASVCLNVAEDHLDWHGGAAAYSEAKAKVYARTQIACVYNLRDIATRTMVENADVVDGCRAIGFGLGTPGPSDVGLVEDLLCDRAFFDDRYSSALEIATLQQLDAAGLSSPHLIENVLAATALARSLGVEPSAIQQAIEGFRLDPHRSEPVGSAGGVDFVDDSKATNPHAAAASLGAFESVVWIVGGLLKGVDLTAVVLDHASRLRGVVVIGAEREAVLELFARHAPAVPVFEAVATETKNVMSTAVQLAVAVALPGDTVLLAPAAASMDQFDDYADRGRQFQHAVRDRWGDGRYDAPPAPATGDA